MENIAYAEIIEILNNIEEKYKEKLPNKLIDFFKENSAKNYEEHILKNISLNEQKLQKETIDILAMLTLNYWCNSEEEKAELMSMYSDNELKYQEELREKYNPDNLFKNKTRIQENIQENVEEKQLVVIDDKPWYKKIFEKIKNMFRRR